MKLLIVLALVAAAVARPEEGSYDRYENFNVDEVLENERLFKSYLECFLKRHKCTAEGQDLEKRVIPEAVQTSCAKCSDKQKHMVGKFLFIIKDKHPTEYAALLEKYDPESKKRDEVEEFIVKYNN